ncbi:hypothetical protein GQ44DRAFT_698817 [Phaeosphaeriaceae sp. PMI808]|nr:hypothetical protein GQ44DRAFT_698817 [Phaeosphaeriaceae sp. PMI808]
MVLVFCALFCWSRWQTRASSSRRSRHLSQSLYHVCFYPEKTLPTCHSTRHRQPENPLVAVIHLNCFLPQDSIHDP